MIRRMGSGIKHYGKQAVKVNMAFALRAVGVPTKAMLYVTLIRNKRSYATHQVRSCPPELHVYGEKSGDGNVGGEEDVSWESEPIELPVTLYKDPLSQKWDEKRFQLILNANVDTLTTVVGAATIDMVDIVRKVGSEIEALREGETLRVDKTIALESSTKGTVVYSKCCISLNSGDAREALLREAKACFEKSHVKIVVMPGPKPCTIQYRGKEQTMAMDSEQYESSPTSTSRTHDGDDEKALSDAAETISKSPSVSDAFENQEACTPGKTRDAESASEDRLVQTSNEQCGMTSNPSFEAQENPQGDSFGNIPDSTALSYPILKSQRPQSRRGSRRTHRRGSKVIRALFPQDQYEKKIILFRSNDNNETELIKQVYLGQENANVKSDKSSSMINPNHAVRSRKTQELELEAEPGIERGQTMQMATGWEQEVKGESQISRVTSCATQTESFFAPLSREINNDTEQTTDEKALSLSNENKGATIGNEQNGLDKEEASASQATIKTLINIAKAIEIQCLEESANEEALQEKHSDMSTGNQLEYLEEILKRIMSSVLDNLKRRAHAEKAFREISEKYGELLGLYSDATLTGQQ